MPASHQRRPSSGEANELLGDLVGGVRTRKAEHRARHVPEPARIVEQRPGDLRRASRFLLGHDDGGPGLLEIARVFRLMVARRERPGDELPPYHGRLALAGKHNRRNAASALAALAYTGVSPEQAEPVLAEFTGAGRRLERRGEAGGVELYDDYAHHPAEIGATLQAARDGGRLLVLFQPHLYSRTRHLARELAAALAAADAVAVAEIYAAREQPMTGVSGKLIVDALAERRPGMPLAWTPALADGARFLAQHARGGDRILTVGAGDVDRAGALLLELLG